jgi:hypothetical protein
MREPFTKHLQTSRRISGYAKVFARKSSKKAPTVRPNQTTFKLPELFP